MNVSKIISFFCFACFIPYSLFAHFLTEYELADAHFPTIQFTNEAIFSIHGLFLHKIDEWEAGDDILLYSNENNFLQTVVEENGMPIIHPILHLSNQTKGNTVLGYLTTLPQIDLITITAIDTLEGTVTLSDSSVWHVKQTDQRFFADWDLGDSVLLGENKGVDRANYPWIIYDVVRSQIARADRTVI